MTPADWKRVKEAFQSALELRPEELKNHLESLRISDPELLQELESLLRHPRDSGPLLAGNSALFHLLDEDECKHWIGRNIGPYCVVSKFGE